MALALEENPPECPTPLPLVRGRWAVACTRANREKRLATYLLEVGLPYLLPMVATKSASRNRILNPLFDGFVFVASNPPRRGLAAVGPNDSEYANMLDCVRASGHTCGFIHARDQALLRSELALLAPLPQLPPGESCRRFNIEDAAALQQLAAAQGEVAFVAPHAFAGLHGVLTSNGSAHQRFAVILKLLGRAVSVEVEDPSVLTKYP